MLWLGVWADACIGWGVAWFAAVFIESTITETDDFRFLLMRLCFGIISLAVAQYFRKELFLYERLYDHSK